MFSRALAIFAFCSVFLSFSAFSITSHERRTLIRRAQIWHPVSIPSLDLFDGPRERGGFEFDEIVHCDYVKKPKHGTSPKFFCQLSSGEVVKVRYGRHNNEVYGQVAASRLIWALGFGANENTPVYVVCHGCSSDPWNDSESSGSERTASAKVFYPATIERKIKGKEIQSDESKDPGWSWRELEQVDEASGGASHAQIDALKLLSVFIAHVDSRPDNQRFVCPENDISSVDFKNCAKPLMYLSDVGTTFGGAHEEPGFTTLKLKRWMAWPIWKDPDACIADLEPKDNFSGKLQNPKISEAGRKFLSDLLSQLSDRQIRDLFRVARANQVNQMPGFAKIDDWVEAFKRRRDQIVRHRCN
jgi:hypothetical protein